MNDVRPVVLRKKFNEFLQFLPLMTICTKQDRQRQLAEFAGVHRSPTTGDPVQQRTGIEQFIDESWCVTKERGLLFEKDVDGLDWFQGEKNAE